MGLSFIIENTLLQCCVAHLAAAWLKGQGGSREVVSPAVVSASISDPCLWGAA